MVQDGGDVLALMVFLGITALIAGGVGCSVGRLQVAEKACVASGYTTGDYAADAGRIVCQKIETTKLGGGE